MTDSAVRVSFVAHCEIALIDAFHLFVSPMLGPACRFEPSCSRYAGEAVRVHGVWRGTWLAVLRLLRCHPFHRGGIDPVPHP